MANLEVTWERHGRVIQAFPVASQSPEFRTCTPHLSAHPARAQSPHMKIPLTLLALSSFAIALEPAKNFPPISTTPPPLTGEWKKQQLTEHFWAEGACAADVN